MDLRKALPTEILTDAVLSYLNLTEVSELRAVNRTMKEIISLNRQHIFTVCFHVLPHGLVEVLNEAGRIQQICTFKEGKKHGEEKLFTSYGYNPDVVEGGLKKVTAFKDGKKHGEEIYFNRGYPITITPFMEGIKHGEEKRFIQRASLMITTPFKEGIKHGVVKYLRQRYGVHEDGLLIKTTTFKKGQLHGESKHWNTKGEVTEVTTYYEGHKISFSCD
jgi:antitoxin component YwqK of YwqJK toxin-antitoxin module